jgi:hypothetical protein
MVGRKYIVPAYDSHLILLLRGCVVLFGLTVCFGFSTSIISVNLFIHFHKSVGIWTVRISWWRQRRQWWRCGPSSFGASEPGWLHHWQVRFQDQRAPWGEHHLLLNFEASWVWTLFKQRSKFCEAHWRTARSGTGMYVHYELKNKIRFLMVNGKLCSHEGKLFDSYIRVFFLCNIKVLIN